MDVASHTYAQLIENLSAWAQSQDDLRALLIIGSRARRDHPADAWSDLDLLLIARDVHPYADDTEWLAQIGTPWITFVEPTPDGRTLERRALFAGGLEVDFVLLPEPAVRQMAAAGVPEDVLDIFRRGVRVLADKDGRLPPLLAAAAQPAAPPAPPDAAEFLNVVNDFWYHAVWTARRLRRGELWWAKSGCDGHLKELLRRMLAWHARLTQGAERDTWMRGRFLEEWADPRALAELPRAFAHYDSEDVWRALQASMHLFGWVSLEAARRLNVAYPIAGQARATQIVATLYVERGQDTPGAERRAPLAAP